MIYPVKSDVIPLVGNLVAALQPFAKANFVRLQFSSDVEKVVITHHPESLLPLLTQLLCRVIAMTLHENKVTVEVQSEDQNVRIRVSNTGVSLQELGEILSGFRQKISVRKREEGGTIFEMLLPKDDAEAAREQAAFSKDERASTFLKKVNAVIMDHLKEEHFDLPALSKALVISRSQLYRRLKPIILQGPAHYIRFVRLQKAKAMLYNSDLTIGEIAFQLGFMNPSHFTRAFHEQFGFNPSDVKRNKKTTGGL